MTASQNLKVNWKTVPTRTITAGGVEFAYGELGTNNPGTPVVFLIHLAAVLDNWDPRRWFRGDPSLARGAADAVG